YNLAHFEEVLVVTSYADKLTQQIAEYCDAKVYVTDSFYADGAVFNKWRALEEALDHFGRHGWMCIMDADILWPKRIFNFNPELGCLYTPYRRMYNDFSGIIPQEIDWNTRFSRHRQCKEFAGYTQIFHASDPVLETIPWHQTNWRHAGGADSFFQAKWDSKNKIRPDWEV